MNVMLIGSCYTFEDESPFVEGEYHEIYREIYGDPIYDVYEDDDVSVELLENLITLSRCFDLKKIMMA